MYNAFYNFSEKPFETTPDPKFLYFTPNHRNALVSVFDGIINRKGFISLTGEVGTGKTTLIHFLLNRLDEKVKTAFILHPSITFKDLLRSILLELGLEVTEGNNKVLLSQLNEYLEKLAVDETLAIIIDEAQNLPKEVMEELGRLRELTSWSSNRLQIVFVGQPEFEDRLNSPGLRQLNQTIGIKCRIRTLTEEESRAYIDHRLKLVGSSGSERFTPKAIFMIINHAKGIPRVINILCDNAFLIGYGLSRKRADVDIIDEVIKEIEGPIPQKSIPAKIVTAIKGFHWMPLRLNFSRRRISFVFLSFLCLGGFILLIYGSPQQKPTNTGNVESIKRHHTDAEISSNEPPLQTMTEEISKAPHPPREQDSVSQEYLQPFAPSSDSPSTEQRKEVLEEVIVVEMGQTLSSLAQKYYRMKTPTLVDLILDFNPEISNAHLIRVNQKIKIPKITKQWLINPSFDHTYKIHVGTFGTPDFVKPYKDEPALKGKRIEALPRKVSPQDTWYRVVVGNFDNEEDALKMIDLLKEKALLPLFGGIPKME